MSNGKRANRARNGQRNNGRNTTNMGGRRTASKGSNISMQGSETIRLSELLSDNLQTFCEAVVHPFGNDAYGATLPDKYQELVVPTTDRMEFDFPSGAANSPTALSDWDVDDVTHNGLQLTGFFIWFEPRCFASGTLISLTLSDNDPGQLSFINRYPYFPVDSTLSVLENSTMSNAYNLCYTAIWLDESPNALAKTQWGLFHGGAKVGPQAKPQDWIIPNYVSIPYTRFANINNNCDKLRILGAGIKIWSEEAPINTGGYSVGGWITIADIREAMAVDHDTFMQATPGALASIVPSIKFSARTPGVGGSTVRYSPLQTPKQLESQYPQIPQDQMMVVQQSGTAYVRDDAVVSSPYYIDEEKGADLAVNDLCTPGTFVPCIYWHFNSSNADEIYTLKLMSMVHSECTPTGTCPFIAGKIAYDPASDHVKIMLENPEVFPPAASGHSFKSFMSKARHIVTKIGKYASKTMKMMAIVDKVFKT